MATLRARAAPARAAPATRAARSGRCGSIRGHGRGGGRRRGLRAADRDAADHDAAEDASGALDALLRTLDALPPSEAGRMERLCAMLGAATDEVRRGKGRARRGKVRVVHVASWLLGPFSSPHKWQGLDRGPMASPIGRDDASISLNGATTLKVGPRLCQDDETQSWLEPEKRASGTLHLHFPLVTARSVPSLAARDFRTDHGGKHALFFRSQVNERWESAVRASDAEEGAFAAQAVGLGGRSRLLDFLDVEGVLDAMAQRLLVFGGGGRDWRRTSSLSLGESAFMARVEGTGESGERCVLTVRMEREQRLEQAHGAARVRDSWALRSVTGEPAAARGELDAVCVHNPPEAVLEAALGALKKYDIEGAFRHASPANRLLMGPLDRFAEMLTQRPEYTPLLGHVSSEPLRKVQIGTERVVVIVGVRAAGRTRHLYSWSLRLQNNECWTDGSKCEGCWMIESLTTHSRAGFANGNINGNKNQFSKGNNGNENGNGNYGSANGNINGNINGNNNQGSKGDNGNDNGNGNCGDKNGNLMP